MKAGVAKIPSLRVLGVRVHPLRMDETLSLLEQWIQERGQSRYVVASGMHAVMESRRNPLFKQVVDQADLFVPDGISLVWAARLHGYPISKRVCGSDLMWELLKVSEERGYSHFFYGDTEETLKMLTERLQSRFPGIKIAGSHSPPFRPLTAEEDAAETRIINQSGADVVWVGLGLPKQELWMFQHRDALNVPVAVGVGAAFKFHSGHVKRAPPWIGDHGLEWLWRLCHEPRRIWRRALVDGPQFAGHLMLELSRLKKYD